MLSILLAPIWLTAVLATPLSSDAGLQIRQSRQIDVSADVSNAQFQSFENPATLRSYLRSKGFTYNVNYNQLSAGVTQINQYFARKAAQTTTVTTGDGWVPQDGEQVQTFTDSTTLRGGPSYTNASLSADTALVSAITFSDGNAATGGGAIQRTQTSSSTSSSGLSNSTTTVTGSQTLVQILTSANVNGVSDEESVNGSPRDALTAGSCAAAANGASSRASILTTARYPVNSTGSQTISNIARSFCEAGVSARRAGTPGESGTSSGGMQAALTDGGVFATVTCNGRKTTNSNPNIVFTIRLQGTYSAANGFAGMLSAARNSSASVTCS